MTDHCTGLTHFHVLCYMLSLDLRTACKTRKGILRERDFKLIYGHWVLNKIIINIMSPLLEQLKKLLTYEVGNYCLI